MSTLTVTKKVSAEAESFIYTQHYPCMYEWMNVPISLTPQGLVRWCRAGRLLTIKLIFTLLLFLIHFLSLLVLLQTVTAHKKDKQQFTQMDRFFILWVSFGTAKGCMVALWLALSLQNTPWLGRCRISTLFLGSVWVLLRFSCTNYREMPAFPYTEVALRRPSWLNHNSARQAGWWGHSETSCQVCGLLHV